MICEDSQTTYTQPAGLHYRCPSAEERSDVSTRAQCRGQGAQISMRRSAAEQRR